MTTREPIATERTKSENFIFTMKLTGYHFAAVVAKDRSEALQKARASDFVVLSPLFSAQPHMRDIKPTGTTEREWRRES